MFFSFKYLWSYSKLEIVCLLISSWGKLREGLKALYLTLYNMCKNEDKSEKIWILITYSKFFWPISNVFTSNTFFIILVFGNNILIQKILIFFKIFSPPTPLPLWTPQTSNVFCKIYWTWHRMSITHHWFSIPRACHSRFVSLLCGYQSINQCRSKILVEIQISTCRKIIIYNTSIGTDLDIYTYIIVGTNLLCIHM